MTAKRVLVRLLALTLRVGWLFVGLVLSLPALLPPIGVAGALYALVLFSGQPSFIDAIVANARYPEIRTLITMAIIFLLYCLFGLVLAVQFALGRPLSVAALSAVAVIHISVLVVFRPWAESTDASLTLGPYSLLHSAYILSVVLISIRFTPAVPMRDLR